MTSPQQKKKKSFTQAALTAIGEATSDAALDAEVPSHSESKFSCCSSCVYSTQSEFAHLLTLVTSNIWRCPPVSRLSQSLSAISRSIPSNILSLLRLQDMRKHHLQVTHLLLTRLTSQEHVSSHWRKGALSETFGILSGKFPIWTLVDIN